MRRANRKQGQSSLELAILFAVVIIAFVALQYYVRNAAAGRLKSSAERQLGVYRYGCQW